jgi:prepilin-type N-terminal cleavage/methylation domain-containing protein/prepilin-type processing-associated H-X9-DG protein
MASAATSVSSFRRIGQRSSNSKGFTLVELLVVIGIIAVLISVLLPTLASARRSANSVKCLASLKEIGNAFSMYAMDNKGMYPAVRDNVNQYTSNGQPANRRWTDSIARYISKQGANMSTAADIAQIRRNSVLWGCPEWAKSQVFGTSLGDKVYNGYGMQYFPGFPERYNNATNAYRENDPARKGYFKQGYWARRGAERLLIADSALDYVQIPPAANSTTSYTTYQGFNTGAVKLQPWDPAPAWSTDDMTIDSRHMKPGLSKKGGLNTKSINALFADGHAASVNAREAFNAIRNPGQDSTK